MKARNKYLIFSAPHKTTYLNISPVLDLLDNSINLIYLCQCNFYTENKKMCKIVKDEYKITTYCLKNPFKFKKYYDPDILQKIFVKIYLKIFLRKTIKLASSYIFCPGGLVEATVAKSIYKQGKKTIMIEGGFPLDLIKKNEYKFYQKIFVKLFINHTINNPLKYVSKLIVAGDFSKELRIKNGFETSKISALGVPRNKNLFYVQDKTNRIAYDIIFLTGSFKFHGDIENYLMQSNYVKQLTEYSTLNKIKVLIQVHPRDLEDYKVYKNDFVSITHENLVSNIQSSKICLSFYSTAVYESLLLNTDAFFVGQKLTNYWPENDLLLDQRNFSKLAQLLSESIKETIDSKKNIAYKHISKDSVDSAKKIKELLLEDVI